MPSTTFAWRIANLERKTADGFVLMAHWTLLTEDRTYASSAYGSTVN